MRVYLKILVMAIVAAAGIWAYRANTTNTRGAMDMNMRVSSGNTPFPVLLAVVERGVIAGAVTYTGSVAPLNEEDIYARVMGRIVEMSVYPGDRVERGQVLARLDDAELSARVQETEAMLAGARANRLQMEQELAMAEAETKYQISVSQRDAKLFEKGAISREEAENGRTMALTARARVEAAQKRLDAAAAMIAQAEAQLRMAQVIRGYVDILAPSTGYVVKRLVAPGVLVEPGMAIFKITQVDKVRLQANVGEKDLVAIKVGSPVTVTTTSDQTPIAAHVTSVFPYVDPGGRTAVVEALVANPERRLIPGQFVRMRFTIGERKDALSVPSGAVARMGGKATVWMLQEDRALPREVETGLTNPDRVEILKGLAEGARVVAQGLEGLYAGALVVDVAAGPPAPAPAGPHENMPGMGEPAARTGEPEKAAVKETGKKENLGHGAGEHPSEAGMALERLNITLISNPVTLSSGSARLRLEVKDAASTPVSDAAVEVHAGMPGMDTPKVAARAVKEAGVYEAIVRLGMVGAWTIEVTATRPQGGTTTKRFDLEVRPEGHGGHDR